MALSHLPQMLHSCLMCFTFLKGYASGRFWKILSSVVGGIVALCIGLLTSVYLATLHENDLWFSNIKVWATLDHYYMIYLFVSPRASNVDKRPRPHSLAVRVQPTFLSRHGSAQYSGGQRKIGHSKASLGYVRTCLPRKEKNAGSWKGLTRG